MELIRPLDKFAILEREEIENFPKEYELNIWDDIYARDGTREAAGLFLSDKMKIYYTKNEYWSDQEPKLMYEGVNYAGRLNTIVS